MFPKTKTILRPFVPQGMLTNFHIIRGVFFSKDSKSLLRFVFRKNTLTTFLQRLQIVKQLYVISDKVDCPHTQHEVISFIELILSVPRDVEGCVVEAGSYKGGSAAKFSIAAKIAKRKLYVFDSFEDKI